MLWTLLASALLLAGASAQCSGTGMTLSGNNYVVDYFTGTLLFSYAINQCTSVNLFNEGYWYKYTCSQDVDGVWSVTKTEYTSSTCSGTGTEKAKWSEADATEPGAQNYFKCDGANNYAGLEISIDSGCAASQIIYGGLGGCAVNPEAFDTKFYCDSTAALVQLYINPESINSTVENCDDNILYCSKWTFGTSCAVSASLDSTPVYGKMTTCVTSMGATTTTAGAATTTSGSGATTTEGSGATTTEGSGATTTAGSGATTTSTVTATTTTMTESTSSARSQFAVLSVIVALVASFWMY